ncbi:MAG: hypothetical protein HZB84_03525 [Deltaproteobacteria bacterium]|nr:hypothetical protein [Deltaproteobacteria bacterium]
MLLKVALFLHIIAALFWVGGMLFLTLVIVPFLNTLQDPREKSRIYQIVGKRYRSLGWVAIITLLITGPVVLYALYGISLRGLLDPAFHSTHFGRTVAIKLTLVVIIVISSLVHDFFLGPMARNSPRFSFYAKVFGRSNLVIALLIVLFAVLIRAGGM